MRTILTIAATLALIGAPGPGFAQSGQGGYLGVNPGGHIGASSASPPPQLGSLQGGYLGKNPGAGVTPLKPATAADYLADPTAWCRNSVEPSRCRPRAAEDHAWCIAHDAAHYADCRRTMDFMGWRP